MTSEPTPNPMVKIVYFDEQSASDYLDISAGGSAATIRENIEKRTTDANARVQATIAAKLSWLPFIGASGETTGGVDMSRVGQSLLSKTLSNTILTDYLEASISDGRVDRLYGYNVRATSGSMAEVKMVTPYMIAAKDLDETVDVARLDDALERAKGYYELIATSPTGEPMRCVLRFNINAFRNNYGLSDLSRMRLTFHAIPVGQTTENSLTLDAELGHLNDNPTVSGIDIAQRVESVIADGDVSLTVYDVLLAGVEHVR